jgi:hypothetical protein
MTNFKDYITKEELDMQHKAFLTYEAVKEMYIHEVAGVQNLGFDEMVRFYQTATPRQIKQMEKIAKSNNKKKFIELIKKVLGVKLHKLD